MEKFGSLLRNARKKAKLSASKAGEMLGGEINYRYIYELEKGRRNPSLALVLKLSEIYKDPSLVTEFMNADPSVGKELIMLNSALTQLPRNKLQDHLTIILKVLLILENNQTAKKEFTTFIKSFLYKYEKHNDDIAE